MEEEREEIKGGKEGEMKRWEGRIEEEVGRKER